MNQICKHNCENKPFTGTGILDVFEFCCKKGFEKICQDIKEKYNLKET